MSCYVVWVIGSTYQGAQPEEGTKEEGERCEGEEEESVGLEMHHALLLEVFVPFLQ